MLTTEEFVRIWENSKNRQEVVDKTGMTAASASARAQKLRELGVNLKRFSRGRPSETIDVSALNALIGKDNGSM